jgi:segregation and condensation protein A
MAGDGSETAVTTAAAPVAVADSDAATPTVAGATGAAQATLPGVVIGAGRRPEATTTVQLDGFDGPLGLLLSLIEARQLDVLTVPLGALAGAYLEALAGLAADRIGNVSAFVAIASQLILIKSRAMLPRQIVRPPEDLADDAPDPEAALRARLILYRAHRDAGAQLLEAAVRRVGLFRREPSAAHAAALAGAHAPDAPVLHRDVLAAALDGLVRVAAPLPDPPGIVPRSITLADRAAIIREAIRHAGVVVLQDLLRDVRDRVVVAVTFLAMLELMKRREIVVEQAEPWGPIVARRTTPEERATAGGPQPVDEDEPIDESMESFA